VVGGVVRRRDKRMDRNIDHTGYAAYEGRRFQIYETGYVEGDTNAFVEGEFQVTDCETEEELTGEELNKEITVNGVKYFLHEWLRTIATWHDNED